MWQMMFAVGPGMSLASRVGSMSRSGFGDLVHGLVVFGGVLRPLAAEGIRRPMQFGCRVGQPGTLLPRAPTWTSFLLALVEGFLSDLAPGLVAWSDLEAEEGQSEQPASEPEAAPFRVGVRSVGPVSY